MMLYHVLRLLPLPVLYGIFLYIGVASLYGVQVHIHFVRIANLHKLPLSTKVNLAVKHQFANVFALESLLAPSLQSVCTSV